MKVRVKDAEVGLRKSYSIVLDEAPSIEGLKVGLLGWENELAGTGDKGRLSLLIKGQGMS